MPQHATSSRQDGKNGLPFPDEHGRDEQPLLQGMLQDDIEPAGVDMGIPKHHLKDNQYLWYSTSLSVYSVLLLYVSTMRISNLSDFTLEIAASNDGSRKQLFYTSTWTNDLQILTDIVGLSEQYFETVATVAGLEWSLSLQPLVTAITTKSAATGGNPLGLEA
tara:strand:- start:2196 stop:2684 length:489 start_codon:yes stop_codon:yes gene_type:complete